MITADYHTHTAFSDDSDAAPEAMAGRAVSLGLKTLCITDHMDYLYPKRYVPETFVFDPDAYFEKLLALRDAYRGRLEIRIGVELGLRNEPGICAACVDYYRELAGKYPFDFVIGSTHILEELDPYYPEYWETHGAGEGMRAYFSSILDNIDSYDMFQVYGHLDYLVRYLPVEMGKTAGQAGEQANPVSGFDGTASHACASTSTREKTEKNYRVMDYIDLLEPILKKLIHGGRGIELNTAGYKYGLPFAHPHAEVLKLYRQLGGEILTIGSDAHAPKHLAYDFGRAGELLTGLGFRYYTVYRERKPVFLPL